LLALAGSLGLSTSAVHLLLDESLTGGLSLGLVDLRVLSVFIVVILLTTQHTCSTNARLCLKVLPLLKW
jgi:hypothetical protein